MPLILPRRQHTAAGTRGLPNDCGVQGFILEGYSVDIVPIIVRHGPPPYALQAPGGAATRSLKGVGCLPQLRRSVGRLSQSVVGRHPAPKRAGCRRVVRLLSRAEERRHIRRIDG
jgi:hypothetical protein